MGAVPDDVLSPSAGVVVDDVDAFEVGGPRSMPVSRMPTLTPDASGRLASNQRIARRPHCRFVMGSTDAGLAHSHRAGTCSMKSIDWADAA